MKRPDVSAPVQPDPEVRRFLDALGDAVAQSVLRELADSDNAATATAQSASVEAKKAETDERGRAAA